MAVTSPEGRTDLGGRARPAPGTQPLSAGRPGHYVASPGHYVASPGHYVASSLSPCWYASPPSAFRVHVIERELAGRLWPLRPQPPVELAAGILAAYAAPLLEVERHAGSDALVAH